MERMMPCRRNKIDTSSGVSESVGTVMLISIVVIGVSLIAVFLFSQPIPTKIPNLEFMTGVNAANTTLYIYHNGGDTLTVGQFSVLVDGVPVSYSVQGGGTQWSLGQNLIVSISKVPKNVQIVYNNTGAAVLINQGSANIVSSTNISADQTPYLDCSAVSNWACANLIPPDIIQYEYQRNITTRYFTLMKYGQLGGAVLGNGMATHLNFTVVDTNSSMTFGSSTCAANSLTKVPLVPGDNVSVYFPAAPTTLTIYGTSPSIWEMTAGTGSNVLVVFRFANGTTVSSSTITQRAICNTFIGQYSSLDSTISLTTDNTNKVTSFTVNKTVYLQGVANTSVITITGFQPTSGGLYLISFQASTGDAFYVVGWAKSIGGLTNPLGL